MSKDITEVENEYAMNNDTDDANSYSTIPKDDYKLMQNGEIVYRYNEKELYYLYIFDSAGAQDAFALKKSSDNGKSWKVINDYVLCDSGVCGMRFIDNQVGFILAKRLDGKSGELHRTNNGGVEFEEVKYPKVSVPAENGKVQVGKDKMKIEDKYFDTPELPTKNNSNLNLVVSTGISDIGSYTRYKAFFKSWNNGLSWKYVMKMQLED